MPLDSNHNSGAEDKNEKEVGINQLGSSDYINRCVTFPGEDRTIYNHEGSIQIVPVVATRDKGVNWLQRDTESLE